MRNEDYSAENSLIDMRNPVVAFVDDPALILTFTDRYTYLETLRYLTRKGVELFADSDDRPRFQVPPRLKTG